MKRTPNINTYLDYELCERLGKTLDELDSLRLSIVERMRENLWKECNEEIK